MIESERNVLQGAYLEYCCCQSRPKGFTNVYSEALRNKNPIEIEIFELNTALVFFLDKASKIQQMCFFIFSAFFSNENHIFVIIGRLHVLLCRKPV